MTTQLYKQVWQQIAESVIEDILEGRYQQEERLKETDLATKYGVSNTPIREALRHLERIGFVKIVPRAGAVVKKITKKEIRDLLSLQCLLEEFAVAESVEHLEEGHYKELEQYLEEMKRLHKRKNYPAYEKANEAFHATIWRACQNDELVELLQSIYLKAQRISVFSRKAPNWSKDVVSFHRSIFDAVMAKDGPKAGRLVRKGLEQYMEEMLAVSDE